MIYLKGIRLEALPPEGSYLCELPVVQHLYRAGGLRFTQPVTFLVGENGTGKSTLLEAIAVQMGFNAEGGSRDHRFSTCDTHSELHRYLVTSRAISPPEGFFLRAESFYNTTTYLLESRPRKPRYTASHERSHGEAFFELIEDFPREGLFLLDEPEAALSPRRLLALLVLMDDLVKDGAQFLISTHSPILMAYPGATIYELSEDGIEAVTLRQTAHYQLTRQFIEAPERMVELLLREDE